MEEQREETEFVGDFREEAGSGLVVSSKTETLDGDVDVPQKEPCIEDEVSDSRVCDVSDGVPLPATGDESLKVGDDNTGNSDSDEKQVKDDVASVEDVVGSASGEESSEKIISSDDVDAITEPETKLECEGDTGTVELKPVDGIEGSEHCNGVHGVNETVGLVEVEMKDEMAMDEVQSKNGTSGESAGEEETVTSAGNEVTDEKEKCEVVANDGAVDTDQNVHIEKSEQSSVDCEMVSVAEKKADHEKESTKKNEENDNEMGVGSEQEKEEKVSASYNEQANSGLEESDADQEKESAIKSEEDDKKMDVDSEQEKEEKVDASYNEQGNSGCEESDADQEKESADKSEEDNKKMDDDSEQANEEFETTEANDSESAQVPEESTHAADISHEEETTNVNQKEEVGEAMEIDDAAEGLVEKDVTLGDDLENAGDGSAGASIVEIQDVPIVEVDRNDSNELEVKEIDERKDDALASDLTETIEAADSANPHSSTEDAPPGEVEPLDHNALYDLGSDITDFIDFTGVSSWSGNIQGFKTETGNLKQNESSEACVASDPILGSEENQEDKDRECLDKKSADQQDSMVEEDYNTNKDPSIDPIQKEDTEMEENPYNYDYANDGTGSDIKTNGVKRKSDDLSEDLPGEGRKTDSLANVSFAQRPSFKIGACIARAASQMAAVSPSVLKGSNFEDETLSVESFVSQLHSAATDPVKNNGVSEIAVGFFLDFRNLLASQQVTAEKASNKRVKTSNSNAGGTEAFEFEEAGDTYWTDKVIYNGGEEQTPATEKGNYQIVPVELKPAQVQRTRRPYRRRQSQINVPHPALDKAPVFDENAPAELVIKFSESDTIPPEKSLSKMFRHFGPIRESQTEVDSENNRARVVFKKGADAKVAYKSAGIINIFGKKTVNYELSDTITETFKVQPYVVSLGEEDVAVCPTS